MGSVLFMPGGIGIPQRAANTFEALSLAVVSLVRTCLRSAGQVTSLAPTAGQPSLTESIRHQFQMKPIVESRGTT